MISRTTSHFHEKSTAFSLKVLFHSIHSLTGLLFLFIVKYESRKGAAICFMRTNMMKITYFPRYL